MLSDNFQKGKTEYTEKIAGYLPKKEEIRSSFCIYNLYALFFLYSVLILQLSSP